MKTFVSTLVLLIVAAAAQADPYQAWTGAQANVSPPVQPQAYGSAGQAGTTTSSSLLAFPIVGVVDSRPGPRPQSSLVPEQPGVYGFSFLGDIGKHGVPPREHECEGGC